MVGGFVKVKLNEVISMPNANDAYAKALRLGQQCYKKQMEAHKDPYLPVLDVYLEGQKIKKEIRLKTQEIPLDLVIGTKTQGRTQAFAANFMPLLESSSEFADKWMRLYTSQLEEGIREPIQCYEVFGRYFVQEGNKRVSVLKFCNSPSIMADVKRIIVGISGKTAEGRLYNAYLNFVEITGVTGILMSEPTDYPKLVSLVDPEWKSGSFDKEQSEDLCAQYKAFVSVYKAQGGDRLTIPLGNAYLLFLSDYGYIKNQAIPQAELAREIDKIWPDLMAYPNKPSSALLTDTDVSDKKKLISLRTSPLKVAFIESKDAQSSAWTKSHEEGREQLQKDLPYDVVTRAYDHADTDEQIYQAMHQAVQDGNEVIFTTSPLMLPIANQFAVKYPKIKILNCSLNQNTGQVRTYWDRQYEIQFLMGVLAGVLSTTGDIGYIADYPIYGTIANINAFALGVQMTDPKAKVYLDWSTTQEATQKDFPTDIDILYVAGQQFEPDVLISKQYGLFDVGAGNFFNIAHVKTNWGVFYTRILKSILNGTWKTDQQSAGTDSINYWWGLSNGMLDVSFNDQIPQQTRRLLNLLKEQIKDRKFHPFADEIKSQKGVIHDAKEGLDVNKVANMDWLCSNVVGTIPKLRQFESGSKDLLALHALDSMRQEDLNELVDGGVQGYPDEKEDASASSNASDEAQK